LAQKLAKFTNQHMMTYFFTQRNDTSFSVILLLFPIYMVKKCSEQKYRTLNTKSFQKWKTTQDNYIFSPKSFAHNFRSFCFCFPSIRLRNITVKSLSQMAWKLTKFTNQHRMICFCTQTIDTWFSVILLLFPINIAKKSSEQKYKTLKTKSCQKWKPTQDNYIFYPNLLHIIFGHFVVASHQYG